MSDYESDTDFIPVRQILNSITANISRSTDVSDGTNNPIAGVTNQTPAATAATMQQPAPQHSASTYIPSPMTTSQTRLTTTDQPVSTLTNYGTSANPSVTRPHETTASINPVYPPISITQQLLDINRSIQHIVSFSQYLPCRDYQSVDHDMSQPDVLAMARSAPVPTQGNGRIADIDEYLKFHYPNWMVSDPVPVELFDLQAEIFRDPNHLLIACREVPLMREFLRLGPDRTTSNAALPHYARVIATITADHIELAIKDHHQERPCEQTEVWPILNILLHADAALSIRFKQHQNLGYMALYPHLAFQCVQCIRTNLIKIVNDFNEHWLCTPPAIMVFLPVVQIVSGINNRQITANPEEAIHLARLFSRMRETNIFGPREVLEALLDHYDITLRYSGLGRGLQHSPQASNGAIIFRYLHVLFPLLVPGYIQAQDHYFNEKLGKRESSLFSSVPYPKP